MIKNNHTAVIAAARERATVLTDEQAQLREEMKAVRKQAIADCSRYKQRYKRDVPKLRKIAHRAVAERDQAVADKSKFVDDSRHAMENENGVRQQLVDEV